MKLPLFRIVYIRFIKPSFDWIIAFIALICVFPLFIIIALAIKIDSKGPVFFRQRRLGKNGQVFIIFKFRSMTIDKPKSTNTILYEDDPRITRVGKLIRKTSIDELPQLFNILKFEMSFIGPRPPVIHFPKEYEEYSDYEKQRFHVKPGISGLAQVRSREEHNWDVNIPIDVEYVQNLSMWNDLKIFFISLAFFFKTDNIYSRKSS